MRRSIYMVEQGHLQGYHEALTEAKSTGSNLRQLLHVMLACWSVGSGLQEDRLECCAQLCGI